jgi:hypothetical protein
VCIRVAACGASAGCTTGGAGTGIAGASLSGGRRANRWRTVTGIVPGVSSLRQTDEERGLEEERMSASSAGVSCRLRGSWVRKRIGATAGAGVVAGIEGEIGLESGCCEGGVGSVEADDFVVVVPFTSATKSKHAVGLGDCRRRPRTRFVGDRSLSNISSSAVGMSRSTSGDWSACPAEADGGCRP